MEKLERKRL